MVASASPLGNAGAGTDSEDGGEARQRRTTQKDEKLSDNETREKEKVMEDGMSSDEGTMYVSLDVLFEQEQVVNDNDGTKNDGTMIAEEAEQKCVIDDSRTTEEENVEKDVVVEDQLDRLKKQYNTVCEMWLEYRTARDGLTKEEENVEEDGVAEDSWNRTKKEFLKFGEKFCEMCRLKKQYDDKVTEYKTEYKKYRDNSKATMTNITEKLEEMVQHQEQQEDTSFMTKDGTEDDKWSVGSEHTSDTEPTDSEEKDQATEIEMINEGKKGNKEQRINKCNGDCIATICFLDLRASLEDPDNHKEKPLTCDMEPDIQRDQQWKLVNNNRKIKKKIMKKRRPDKPIMHKPVPLSCNLEPDIAEQLKLVYDKRKIKMKEIDKRTLADHIRNTPEPLSCDLEPDIEINKI